MSQIDKTFQGLADLILRDQFLHVCNRDMSVFINEHIPKSIGEMSTLADQLREARFTNAASLVSKSGPVQHQFIKVKVKVHHLVVVYQSLISLNIQTKTNNRFVPRASMLQVSSNRPYSVRMSS